MSDESQSSLNTADAARRWADFFENLTPDSLDRIGDLCSQDVRFRDPFNDHTGTDAVRQVFVSMFETVDEPSFTVQRIAVDEDTAFLSWSFTFRRKGSAKPWLIEGVSEVRFDESGMVKEHLDHWDASQQFYAKLPLIGRFIRLIADRVGV